MDVSNMEIGNPLFGHSRGEYRLNRNENASDRLYNALYELGLNSYDYQDSDLDKTINQTPHLMAERTPRGE